MRISSGKEVIDWWWMWNSKNKLTPIRAQRTELLELRRPYLHHPHCRTEALQNVLGRNGDFGDTTNSGPLPL